MKSARDDNHVVNVIWDVERMKPARIIVLVVAVAAGGIAALLMAGPSDLPYPSRLWRRSTRSMSLSPKMISASASRWDSRILSGRRGLRHRPIRHSSRSPDRPDAIVEFEGAIARTPFVAGEPLRENRLIKGKGSGYMAAILPSGMRAISTEISAETGAGGFILPNDRVDVILTRRDREAEKFTGVEIAHFRNDSDRRPGIGDRPDRRGKERPASCRGENGDARTHAAPV